MGCGTRAHVLEPPLCGCGAEYLDLGRFYDRAAVFAKRQTLAALKQENAALYPLAYHCLRAAAALSESLAEQAASTDVSELTRMLLSLLPSRSSGKHYERRCFLSAITPKGCLMCSDTMQALCPAVCVLEDSFGLGAKLLAELAAQYHGSRISAFHPLSPHTRCALLLPEAGFAFVCSSAEFVYDGDAFCRCDLDLLVLCTLSQREALDTQFLLQTRAALVEQAVSYLRQAKAVHDQLELAYRPTVDFAGITGCTEALCSEIFEY